MTVHKTYKYAGTVALALLASTTIASAESVTLHALMEDVPETTIIEKMLPEFTKETGIKVEFEKVGYGDMHDKLVAQLVSGESYYNLLSVDFLWAGEFPAAGWLTDLKPYVEKSGFDLKPFIPSTLDLLGATDEAMPILPMYNYSMGVIYRTDLLKDEKLAKTYEEKTGKKLELPSTLADYVELAKFMKAEAGVAGAAMQGQKGDPNAMEFSNYLFAEGGNYMDGDKVVLDSDAGVKALDLYVDAIQNAAQTGALSATLDDTMRLMCSGKAFSMVTYWWMLPQLDNKDACPAVAGKLSLGVMPGGHGESGGWGWGIPANVPDDAKDAAWTFITWVQGKDVAIKRALEGHAPVRSDVFQDKAVLEKYPFYANGMDVVASGKSFPIFTYSAQYEDVLGTQVSLAASGDTTATDAISSAAKGLSDLLSK
ncbi:carbohydrate ABC transporter substrate-binding protein (CUT1 family) [Breoghania corrubedonensis]|uniref:Carbohydrate ABC transporter substrate-binding protein (CUT1 family) n=1 Tax=Breoghania corrubedonensis TaxID=665038 RepID=A0A2T5V8Z7_9HYPH|nr:extracellular solute-binding protein [Breoghania corrubedonensis]PTW60223.1 carbohydrate ABC transporter substrate-binding protein (CUT1 family) [Breoghania corrubedonensis]